MKKCMKPNRPLQHFSLIHFNEQEFELNVRILHANTFIGIKQFQQIVVIRNKNRRLVI